MGNKEIETRRTGAEISKMRPIYVIKDSNSLNTKHESNLNLNQAGNVELSGKLVNSHKTRAYATSSMSVSSPTSLLNVSDLSNLSSPFYLTTGQQQQATTGVKGRSNIGGTARSASVTTAPGPTPVAGSSSLHHSNSGRSTSSSMNTSSTSSFVYSSTTLASSTTGTSKNVPVAVTATVTNPMSSSSICLNNMVHASYQPSMLNNAGSNAGGSLSNLSSYSCNSTPSTSSPPFYLIALPTKTVTGDVNDMNNNYNYKANVMLDTNSSLLINQSYTKPRTALTTSNDAIDTTSLFSPSKISKLQKSNQNLNDRFNYQTQITNLLGQSGTASLMNSGDYWKEFILDASNYESSLSHYNPPNANYNDTPLQTPSTAPVPTRSPLEDINNNQKPSGNLFSNQLFECEPECE